MSRTATFVWDHRQQPDWDRLADTVRALSGGTVHLRLLDLPQDDMVLVVADTALTETQATGVYDHWQGAGQPDNLITTNEGDPR